MSRATASYQPRNPELYQAMREYTVTALRMLKQQTPQSWQTQWPDATLWEYEGGDLYIQRSRTEPNWIPAFIKIDEALRQLPEYTNSVIPVKVKWKPKFFLSPLNPPKKLHYPFHEQV